VVEPVICLFAFALFVCVSTETNSAFSAFCRNAIQFVSTYVNLVICIGTGGKAYLSVDVTNNPTTQTLDVIVPIPNQLHSLWF